LHDVRAKFEGQFPNIIDDWNDAGAIPVTIIGVRFFDFAHNQAGRAPNIVEIHPILNIEFGTPPPLPAAPLLTNPGFEDGSAGWTATSGVLDSATGEHAHTGHGKAWLGGYDTKHTDTLFQNIAIPATASAVTVSFYLHISTQEEGGVARDTLK